MTYECSRWFYIMIIDLLIYLSLRKEYVCFIFICLCVFSRLKCFEFQQQQQKNKKPAIVHVSMWKFQLWMKNEKFIHQLNTLCWNEKHLWHNGKTIFTCKSDFHLSDILLCIIYHWNALKILICVLRASHSINRFYKLLRKYF